MNRFVRLESSRSPVRNAAVKLWLHLKHQQSPMGSFLAAAVLTFVFSVLAWPQHSSAQSAVRLPGESFQTALERNLQDGSLLVESDFASDSPPRTSALESKKAFPEFLDEFEKHPIWRGSKDELQQIFEGVRDSRPFRMEGLPDFPRRASWLYPDDGCFDRAEFASREIIRQFGVAPLRIFAFGNLGLSSPYSETGQITWWFHVTVGIRTEDGVMILDPSVEPHRPLRIGDWLYRIGASSSEDLGSLQGEVAVCDALSYYPTYPCRNSDRENPHPDRNMGRWLIREWHRFVDLGLDPSVELGERPPWFFRR